MISSIAFVCLVGGFLATAGDAQFRALAANDYAHQTSDKVTIGAKAFDNEDLTAEAFGKKTDLLKYGILPVLVVIENKRSNALDLRDLEVNLVAADGRHVANVAPEDFWNLGKPTKRPSAVPRPPIPLPSKKNPLSSPILVQRAFAAKMLPPGDSASGFFYFEANPEAGDKIYVNGMREARSGDEILYFEFGIDPR